MKESYSCRPTSRYERDRVFCFLGGGSCVQVELKLSGCFKRELGTVERFLKEPFRKCGSSCMPGSWKSSRPWWLQEF